MSPITAIYPGDGVVVGVVVVLGAVFLLTSAALIVALLLGRRPTARHTVLASTLICCLVAPLVVAAMRSMGISTLAWTVRPAVATKSWRETLPRVVSDDFATLEADGIYEDVVRATPAYPPADNPPALIAEAPPFPPELDADPSLWQAPPPLVAVLPARRPVVGLAAMRSEISAALAIWLAVATLLLARVGYSSVRIWQWRRACRPWSAEQNRAIAAEVRRCLGSEQLPPILTCQRVASPLAVGLFRGIVILPAGLPERITSDELCDVLVHECAHIMRRDPWVRYLQAIAGSLFWPLPTVHLANAQLSAAREEICDNYVLARREPRQYAETLLKVATLVGPLGESLAVGILPRRGKLESRIEGLIAADRSTATRTSRAGAGLCLSLLLLASVIACGTTIRQAKSEGPAKETSQQSPPNLETAETEKPRLVVLPDSGEPPAAAQGRIDAGVPSPEEVAAEEAVRLGAEAYELGEISGPEEQYVWSQRLMNAQIGRDPGHANRVKAVQSHLARMEKLRDIAVRLQKAEQGTLRSVAMTKYYVAEAQRQVKDQTVEAANAAARATLPPTPLTPETAPPVFQLPSTQPPGGTPAASPPPIASGPIALPPGGTWFWNPPLAESEDPEPFEGTYTVKKPSLAELLEIEKGFIEARRNVRTGRVVVSQYYPIDDRGTLQFAKRYTLFFDGEKTRADEMTGQTMLFKISTPTSFVRWRRGGLPGGDSLSLLFEPQAPTPHAAEVPNARLLGLVAWPLDSIGQFSLDSFFSEQERDDLKIETGVEEGEPVLKVSYEVANPKGDLVSKECWLAPRRGNLPVYLSTSSGEGEQLNRQSMHCKLRLYKGNHHFGSVPIWYPAETKLVTQTGTKPLQNGRLPIGTEIVRVESASFNVFLEDSTFERAGVEDPAIGGQQSAGPRPAETPRAAVAPASPKRKRTAVRDDLPIWRPENAGSGVFQLPVWRNEPENSRAAAASSRPPSAGQLLSLEKIVVDSRRSIRSGRVVVALYKPIEPGLQALELDRRCTFTFDGEQEREDVEENNSLSVMLRTPTLFRSRGPKGEVLRVFEGGDRPPTPELTDPRTLGMAADYFGNAGSLDGVFVNEVRDDLKIVWEVEDDKPVFKVKYRTTVDGYPAEIEYWLAQRCGYLPVYIARSKKFEKSSLNESIRAKLRHYEPSGVWFPSEVVFHSEQTLSTQVHVAEQIARVESAEFNQKIDPSTFLLDGMPVPEFAPATE
jgi:beta-lactamase regulating signal transducer with metallopeptidase domain